MWEPSEGDAERTRTSPRSKSRERSFLPEGTDKRKKAPAVLKQQQSSELEGGHSTGKGIPKACPAARLPRTCVVF